MDPMILLQRWSGRIMSGSLGKIFFHQNTLFLEKMSVQNKNLKFLSLVFWKINLSKLTLFFSNFPCYMCWDKHTTFETNNLIQSNKSVFLLMQNYSHAFF